MGIFSWIFVSVSISLVSHGAQVFKTEKGSIEVNDFYVGLERPWGMVFLPDGRLLVTERPGRLKLISNNGESAVEVGPVPKVFAKGQGGLLDVALDPDFKVNQTIYLSYSEPGKKRRAGTAVARAEFNDGGLKNLKVIWRQIPKVRGNNHWGSRLVFSKDKKLFITMGDRYSYMKKAQDLSTHFGKVVRINPDGSIPKDNPFYGDSTKKQDIWSYGHRNMQGAALNPFTKELWTHEHGAKGGDEINLDEAGKNYGWPVITHGVDYTGFKIGEGTHKEGMEQPLHFWVPSIAPSGMTFYEGASFPQWKGNLFVGSLKFRYLNRIEINGNKIVHEEPLLKDLQERIRDVEIGPGGVLYVAVDNSKGRILRVYPTSKTSQ